MGKGHLSEFTLNDLLQLNWSPPDHIANHVLAIFRINYLMPQEDLTRKLAECAISSWDDQVNGKMP